MPIKNEIKINEIPNIIDNIMLNDVDLSKINNLFDKLDVGNMIKGSRGVFKSIDDLYNFIEDVYKLRFYLSLPVPLMAKYFNCPRRTMNYRLEKFGWRYNKKEAQIIAADKSRDYTEIRIKSKKTSLKSISKSNIEDRCRETLNLDLTQLLPKCDVIVGLNNLSILSDISKEIDIPIIIINNNNIFKFAIEFQGSYWHKIKDINKINNIIYKGFTYYEIWQCNTDREREELNVGSVDQQIDFIVNNIIELVK